MHRVQVFIVLCVLLTGVAHAVETTFEVHPGELITFDLQTGGTIFQIGVAPRRIDIITAASGLQFEPTHNG